MTNETLNIGEIYTLFVIDKEQGQKYAERQRIIAKSPLIEHKSVYLGTDLRTEKHGFVSRAKQEGSLDLILYALDDEAVSQLENGRIWVPPLNQGKVISKNSCPNYEELNKSLKAKGL